MTWCHAWHGQWQVGRLWLVLGFPYPYSGSLRHNEASAVDDERAFSQSFRVTTGPYPKRNLTCSVFQCSITEHPPLYSLAVSNFPELGNSYRIDR